MSQTIVPTAGPKFRLVEAAEKLFAEKGFDLVSVRDITKEAGANVAAINYHFGSREGLVAAVMRRYIAPVHEERLARLEAAERRHNGQPVPVEEILSAFVRPLVDQVKKSEHSERLFCRLLGRIFSVPEHGSPREVDSTFDNLVRRFGRALVKSVPHLSLEEAIWRLHFSVGVMTHMLANSDLPQRMMLDTEEDPTLEDNIDRFMRFASAGVREGAGIPQGIGSF